MLICHLHILLSEMSFHVFAHFLTWIFCLFDFYLGILRKFFIYSKYESLVRYVFYIYVFSLSVASLNRLFCRTNLCFVLFLIKSNVLIFFLRLLLLVSNLRTVLQALVLKDFLLYFLVKVLKFLSYI